MATTYNYNVFVSYERSDRAIAKQLAEALVREGLSVWSDNDITAGEDWPVAIEEALNRSESVVVLWSKRSIKSKFVRNEARQGDQRGILVPAFLENVRPPFEFDHVQAENLIGWQGGRTENLLQLVAQIRARSQPPAIVGAEVSSSSERPVAQIAAAGASVALQPQPVTPAVVVRSQPVAAPDPNAGRTVVVIDAAALGYVGRALGTVLGLFIAYYALKWSYQSVILPLIGTLGSWSDRERSVIPILLGVMLAAGVMRLTWYFADEDISYRSGFLAWVSLFVKSGFIAAILAVIYSLVCHKWIIGDDLSGLVIATFAASALSWLTIIVYAIFERWVDDFAHNLFVVTTVGVGVGLLTDWLWQFIGYVQPAFLLAAMKDFSDDAWAPLLIVMLIAIVVISWRLAREISIYDGGDAAAATAGSTAIAAGLALVYLWFLGNGSWQWPGAVTTGSIAVATMTVGLYVITH